MRKHRIARVTESSIADSLGLEASDFLLEINGKQIVDVFDYRMETAGEELTLLAEKANGTEAGELWELEIEKDAACDLGLEFDTALMDEVRLCRNRCIFCFIDQQPPALRSSLYVKDDDTRLSFLHGNYVTLTNLDGAEAARIVRHRLSPMRISVHTMDMELRRRMMRNENAGRLLKFLHMFNEAGIEMHFQIVLCKDWNDGAVLDESISKLLAFRPRARSLAVVPAGLTRWRGGLTPLAPFTPREAAGVITQVEKWQTHCREKHGTAFVFAADEWYVLARCAAPDASECEDFPQLDNGVGMIASFAEEFHAGARCIKNSVDTADGTAGFGDGESPLAVGIVTGMAAYDFMRGLISDTPRVKIFPIRNRFFGGGVTVSGLLTGTDIIAQMQGKCAGLHALFLPANAFRADTEIMLDGMTRDDIARALGVSVYIGSADGGDFFRQLIAISRANAV